MKLTDFQKMELVRDIMENKMSKKEICEKFGITSGTYGYYLNKLGLTKDRVKVEESTKFNEIVEMAKRREKLVEKEIENKNEGDEEMTNENEDDECYCEECYNQGVKTKLKIGQERCHVCNTELGWD